jgi:hypothetical protein
MPIYAGDIITKAEEQYVEALEKLWDMVSDMTEYRLREGDIPDDYEALVGQMVECNRILDTITKENKDE